MNVNDLRTTLHQTIDLLLAGKISVEKAKEVGHLCQVAVNSVNAETKYLAVVLNPENRKSTGSGYVPHNSAVLTLSAKNKEIPHEAENE